LSKVRSLSGAYTHRMSRGTERRELPRGPAFAVFGMDRFVRSIREDSLSRVIPLGERHLRWVVGEYVEHYHLERNHQGLGNELIEPPGAVGSCPNLRARSPPC